MLNPIRLLPALALMIVSVPSLAQQFVPVVPPVGPGMPNPYLQMVPVPTMPTVLPFAGMPIPFIGTLQPQPTKPYSMRPGIPQETKRQMMQMMMPIMTNIMRMSMPDAMNWFAHKIKAKPGLTFDEVVESMMLRANQHNFKYVGSNLMYKDFQAVLGDEGAPRVEVFSFCDIAVGRDLLKIIPEMVVFLPCRIAVMEDADKNIWILSLDWDVTWLDMAGKAMGITPELRKGAEEIRVKMDEMMRAAANGEL